LNRYSGISGNLLILKKKINKDENPTLKTNNPKGMNEQFEVRINRIKRIYPTQQSFYF